MSKAYLQAKSHLVISIMLFLCLSAYAHASSSLWQGPYVSAYTGGAFGDTHGSTNAGVLTGNAYFVTGPDINVINNAGATKNNPNAGIIGIAAGHDWVYEQLVYGLVLDYGKLPLSSSNKVIKLFPDNPAQYSVYTSISTNWLFTLRGRLGYQTVITMPSLFYLTGGMTLTQLKVNNNYRDNSALGGVGGGQAAENQIGWALGAGLEVFAYKRLSVGLEYLYLQFPHVTTASNITNSQGGFGIPTQSLSNLFSSTGKLHANLFKLILNYRFCE